jgi:hypothetical protein
VGYVTTRTIMLHVTLRYNERGNILLGHGQVTWLEHIYMVSPTCHVTRMINKKTLKELKKYVTSVGAEQCCVFLQLQGPSLK